MGFLGLTMAGLGGSLGSGISSGISSAASGMMTGAVGGLFGGIRAKKQHKRNKEILALQNKYEQERMKMQEQMNQEQAKFNQGLAIDMFDYTSKYNSPAEERKRIEEAGLSPALMYGGGGAGGSGSGSTSGAGEAQGVTALQPMGLQVALQAEMQKAQIDALNAQTLNTNAQTAKTASEIEGTKSGTKLNEVKFKETLKNIDAIQEYIRASQVGTRDQEAKNEILNKLKNITLSKYVHDDGTEQKLNIFDYIAENEIKKVLIEEQKLGGDEIEMLNRKEILYRIGEDIKAVVQGEIDSLTLPTEQKKALKKAYERNEWELRNDKAFGDIINELGGNDKYSKLLQGIIKWLFSK